VTPAAGAWVIAVLLQSSTLAKDDDRLDVHVHATVAADTLPRRDVSELRPTIGAEVTVTPIRQLTIRFDGVVEGLLADRGRRVTRGIVSVRDACVETHASVVDVRAGYGRIVWGRLDEIAPTDVINPLDAARFLFDGRSEARLPVTFVRARVSASEHLRVEGVLVPRFRRGTFDRLDERSSPFNLVPDAVSNAGIAVGADRRQIEPRSAFNRSCAAHYLSAAPAQLRCTSISYCQRARVSTFAGSPVDVLPHRVARLGCPSCLRAVQRTAGGTFGRSTRS